MPAPGKTKFTQSGALNINAPGKTSGVQIHKPGGMSTVKPGATKLTQPGHLSP